MPHNIVGFKESEADEFLLYMEHIAKKKRTAHGFSVSYEDYNYKFNSTRADIPDSLGSYRDVRLQPEPVIKTESENKDVKDNEVTPPPPVLRGRGRARAPTTVTPTEEGRLPNLGYTSVHYYRNMEYDTSCDSFRKNATVVFYPTYKIPRLLMLKDFESKSALFAKLQEIVFGNSGSWSIDAKMSKIKRIKQIHLYGIRIEGVHFNKVEDTSTLPFKIHTYKSKKIFEFKEQFYISEALTDNGNIKHWLHSKPINEESFLESLKNHFLNRMKETVSEKEKQAEKLQQQLLTLQKEVGEIRFVENSVRHSTNGHFTGVIDKIRKLPTVKKLNFTALGFVLETQDLYIEPEEDRKFYVGRYEIVIEVTDTFKAEFRNLEAPEVGTNGYKHHVQHPHGSCQGSHYYVMMQAIRSIDYFTFVLAAIERLQTVNVAEQDANYIERCGYPVKKPTVGLKKFDDYYSLIDEEKLDRHASRPSDDEDDGDYDDDEEDDDDED